jgi:hypothetical protein
MSKMMLEKKWSCSFFEIVSLSQFIPLFENYSNKCRHVATTEGKSSFDNFKCAWKGSEFELFAPIATNKNACESNKNLEVMINATNTQPPKYIVNAMVFVEMKLILRLEMGTKLVDAPKEPLNTQTYLGLKAS